MATCSVAKGEQCSVAQMGALTPQGYNVCLTSLEKLQPPETIKFCCCLFVYGVKGNLEHSLFAYETFYLVVFYLQSSTILFLVLMISFSY